MNRREELIRKGLNKWAKNDFKGILNYATGVGKTYAMVLATEHAVKTCPKERVLIVAPTNVILEGIKENFKKFKKTKYLKHCDLVCYASLPNIKSDYSLVVFDEVHHLVTEKKLICFKNCVFKYVLGLTASLTEEQELDLHFYCRIVDVLTLEDVEDEGFIADFTIINFPVDFNRSEKDLYDEYTKKIEWTYQTYGSQAWKAIGSRSNLVYNARNKLKIVKSLVELFPEEYGIVFSLQNDYAQQVADAIGTNCTCITSKDKAKSQVAKLQSFVDGRRKVNIISAVKMFDEGVTLPRLSFGVALARYSKERQSIQTIGRLLRADIKDKHSILIRVYVRGTVEEKWVRESQKNFNVKYVNSYDELKNTIEEARGGIKRVRTEVKTDTVGVSNSKYGNRPG
tara:strand:+ start:4982 stop:6175 length:1194 start_codon:yes stop_codon:yes gene_type:complete